MIKADTIARTVILALALVNQILQSTGHPVIPVEDAQLQEFITLGFTVVTAVWAWWKNNSFTEAACKADSYMEDLRKGE